MNKMFTFKVKEDDRQGWGGIALITAGQWLGIPVFMVGGMLSEGLSWPGVVFCTVAGGLILLFCACFSGVQGSKSGLPLMVASANYLGVQGARLVPVLLIAVTCMGWFGVQAAICGASFSVMATDVLGVSIPDWGGTIFWGAVMGFSAMYGYSALKRFYYILTPALFLIAVYAVVWTMFYSEADSAAALIAWRPAEPMSYITAITMIVGAWATGSFGVSDYCRYAKKPRSAALGVSVGLIFALPTALLGGAGFRIATGNADITAILNGMGFPAISLIFLVFAIWTINMINAYSGGIAVSALLNLGEKRLKVGVALTGIIGTALGALGILTQFMNFLSLLSSIVPPVLGVIMGAKITDVLLHREKAGESAAVSGKSAGGGGGMPSSGFHIPGLIAYGAGALTAWLTAAITPFFIPPINGILVAAAVYSILEMVLRRTESSHLK